MKLRARLATVLFRLAACASALGLPALQASLPEGWSHGDIGAVNAAGGATFDAQTKIFTISGPGTDIAGTADRFHYVHRPLNGDGYIVARVVSLTPTHAGAKAGVMIRESLDAGSRHATLVVTPGSGTGLLWRTGTGGGTSSSLLTGLTAPRWVKLERQGKVIIGSESEDGVVWSVVRRITIDMAAEVQVGLIACSRTSGLASFVADQVVVDDLGDALALPWPWTEHTVGNPTDPGAALHDGSYVLSNLGADLSGTADRFKFVAQPLLGDGALTFQLASAASSNPNSRFGLIMRESLDSGARQVFLGVTSGGELTRSTRLIPGTAIAGMGEPIQVSPPVWIRLQRIGDVFTLYSSVGGDTWTEVGATTLTLSPTLEVGLAYANRSASVWAIGIGDALTLVTSEDADGNGLPDAWELRHFGSVGVAPAPAPHRDCRTQPK